MLAPRDDALHRPGGKQVGRRRGVNYLENARRAGFVEDAKARSIVVELCDTAVLKPDPFQRLGRLCGEDIMQGSSGLGASPVGVDANGTVPGGREGPEQPVICCPV